LLNPELVGFTGGVNMTSSRINSRPLVLSLTLLLLVLAAKASAQNAASVPVVIASAPSATTAPNSAPLTREQILQELEQMRERIQQLEAQESAAPVANVDPPNSQSPQQLALASSTAQSGNEAAAVSPEKAQTTPAKQPDEPFAFADWTWLNGNARTKEPAFDSKFFTPEIRADADYIYDFAHPADDTIGGSSEVFRSGELQVTQLGVGGNFHYDNVEARVMTQFGMYSTTTPRNDASPGRGQWQLADAYRYLSEAYGGYHWTAMHGVNLDAGIFMSYIGLFSYYNFDNWAYQPSYVSSNTPWFFNGVRLQIFPTDKLKIEPWLINGWQSYGKFNAKPGLGGQVLYRPTGWLSLTFNNYGLGTDTLGNARRARFHTDDSVEVKYWDHPSQMLDRMAFSLTGDMGCESGGGVACWGSKNGHPKQSFLGYMLYDRFWLDKDLFGVTVGGGEINNPGRYLVLLPPINGATALSGTPYFTENPGDPFKAWDASLTFDYMPSQYITFRWEYDHRGASVPYFSGHQGITPFGGDQGAPGSFVPRFTPDLSKHENRLDMAVLVKF
jgi:hypothetical protein